TRKVSIAGPILFLCSFVNSQKANQYEILAMVYVLPQVILIIWVSRRLLQNPPSVIRTRDGIGSFSGITITHLWIVGQQARMKRVKFKIKSKIFLLDSTTISLCLSLFDWAKYKTAKGAV